MPCSRATFTWLVEDGISAPAGERFSPQSPKRNGATGAVIDGFHRDSRLVLKRGFPIFSRGAYGQDAGTRSTVRDFGVGIEVGLVKIAPGDLVIGDRDGVVIVPAELENEVLERSLEKVATESLVLDDIEEGMTATEAFEQYGVL